MQLYYMAPFDGHQTIGSFSFTFHPFGGSNGYCCLLLKLITVSMTCKHMTYPVCLKKVTELFLSFINKAPARIERIVMEEHCCRFVLFLSGLQLNCQPI